MSADPDASSPTRTTVGVVVGVKRHQPCALTFAAEEARRRHEGLRVVHAVRVPTNHLTDEEGDRLRAVGEQVLTAARGLIDQAPAPPATEYVLGVASPRTTLADESRTASCLVIGSDDVAWFERLIGGEVATWLVRHAACPVFVIPETPAGPVRAPSDVVVAVDLDVDSADLLHAAFDQAELRHARLRILHVVGADAPRLLAEDARQTLDDRVAPARAEHPSVRVITTVVTGEADQACAAAGEHAGLLVLGRPRSSEHGRLLSRRVAADILRTARCPVLVVPEHHG